MTFKVQSRRCASCIYRKDSSLDLKALEDKIRDPKLTGYFLGYRECHHAPRGSGICCRGFWDHWKEHFTAGQLAQRLGLVEYVSEDIVGKAMVCHLEAEK